jgi:hypothetical protein
VTTILIVCSYGRGPFEVDRLQSTPPQTSHHCDRMLARRRARLSNRAAPQTSPSPLRRRRVGTAAPRPPRAPAARGSRTEREKVGQWHFGKRRPSSEDHRGATAEEQQPGLAGLDATLASRCRGASYRVAWKTSMNCGSGPLRRMSGVGSRRIGSPRSITGGGTGKLSATMMASEKDRPYRRDTGRFRTAGRGSIQIVDRFVGRS